MQRTPEVIWTLLSGAACENANKTLTIFTLPVQSPWAMCENSQRASGRVDDISFMRLWRRKQTSKGKDERSFTQTLERWRDLERAELEIFRRIRGISRDLVVYDQTKNKTLAFPQQTFCLMSCLSRRTREFPVRACLKRIISSCVQHTDYK